MLQAAWAAGCAELGPLTGVPRQGRHAGRVPTWARPAQVFRGNARLFCRGFWSQPQPESCSGTGALFPRSRPANAPHAGLRPGSQVWLAPSACMSHSPASLVFRSAYVRFYLRRNKAPGQGNEGPSPRVFLEKCQVAPSYIVCEVPICGVLP